MSSKFSLLTETRFEPVPERWVEVRPPELRAPTRLEELIRRSYAERAVVVERAGLASRLVMLVLLVRDVVFVVNEIGVVRTLGEGTPVM